MPVQITLIRHMQSGRKPFELNKAYCLNPRHANLLMMYTCGNLYFAISKGKRIKFVQAMAYLRLGL